MSVKHLMKIHTWRTSTLTHIAAFPLTLLFLVTCTPDRAGSPTEPTLTPQHAIAASSSSDLLTGPAPVILTTDKSDYLPGETVSIIGHGWKPGSTVSLFLEEMVDSPIDGPWSYSVTVDDNGDFTNQEFTADENDRGVMFRLTATGDGEGGQGFFTDDGQSGTTLTATKTAAAHYTRTFHWTIDKSVTPDEWNLFKGDQGTSEYTVTVTKDNGTDAAWLDGQICVTNGGAVATENFTIVDAVTVPPSQTVIASTNVDVSAHPVLAAGESHCYDYHVDIPSANVVPGDNYKNTAHITITNHSGHLGTPFGPDPSATAVLPNTPTLINDTINVDDTNGGSWSFSDDGSQSYTKTFKCDGDAGTKNNTATIRETEQSASASVTVNCYDLAVTKDATTSFKRKYNWTIAKSADQTSLTLAENQSFLVNYSVTMGATFTDSDWKVSGNIKVHNPAPIDATINSVSDVVSTAIAGSVVCGVSFPYTLAAGGDLNCTYSADLPDATSRTNTATATLQNYSYDKDKTATASGATDFTGTASVGFGSTKPAETDKCVDVSDTKAGALGPVCFLDLPKTFQYSLTIGPYATCGTRTVDNTASFDAQDTHATSNSSWTVNVNVPCSGCSLTLGYWKTHAGFGPQADMVTHLLPIWLGTSVGLKSQQVTSAGLAVQFLSLNGSNNVFDANNGINKLYAQLLAAKLDIANGSDGSAIASTISAADAFLATHNSLDWGGLSKAQKNQVLAWVTTLDNYNNGLIGPGHCTQ